MATVKKLSVRKRKATNRKAVESKSLSQVKGAVGGPVTLKEAQAIAEITKPQRSSRGASVREGPTLNSIGAQQKMLKAALDDERAAGLRDYTETMKVMKARGVRLPASAGNVERAPKRSRNASGRADAVLPLQIVAEGDSWFKYPVPGAGGGIIRRLEQRIGVPILNMAEAGDEVRFMLGVEQRERLMRTLIKGCPAGGPWDVLLFSGGGNDIVDNPMVLWVRRWDPTMQPKYHLDQARFGAVLAIVRAGYEDLIALRDRHSPNTHIVLHGYDFAIPDGRGVCNHGPWMSPTFDLCGFPKAGSAREEVVHEMLLQFAAMVKGLIRPTVSYVDTQGTLQASGWANELHPTPAGFSIFADMFRQHLARQFPDKVR